VDESWENVDWAEILEEPPGGVNFGRERSASGRWKPLEAIDWEFSGKDGPSEPVPVTEAMPSIKRGATVRRHGTTYTYINIGCRCQVCKTGWAAYIRKRRREQEE
jgi:hypothetical protein